MPAPAPDFCSEYYMTNVERFHELCREAEAETDPIRLDEIAKKILDLLEEEALSLLAREHEKHSSVS